MFQKLSRYLSFLLAIFLFKNVYADFPASDSAHGNVIVSNNSSHDVWVTTSENGWVYVQSGTTSHSITVGGGDTSTLWKFIHIWDTDEAHAQYPMCVIVYDFEDNTLGTGTYPYQDFASDYLGPNNTYELSLINGLNDHIELRLNTTAYAKQICSLGSELSVVAQQDNDNETFTINGEITVTDRNN